MEKVLVVTNAEAARLLTDTSQLRLLEPFFKREATLSEVAAETGVKLNTLLYRVNRFVELGLLTVVREEPRRGKPVKVYRASAEDFFVPFEVMASSSLEQLLLGLLGDVEKVFHREAAKTFQETFQTKGVHVALNEGHMSVVLGDREGVRRLPRLFSVPAHRPCSSGTATSPWISRRPRRCKKTCSNSTKTTMPSKHPTRSFTPTGLA